MLPSKGPVGASYLFEVCKLQGEAGLLAYDFFRFAASMRGGIGVLCG